MTQTDDLTTTAQVLAAFLNGQEVPVIVDRMDDATYETLTRASERVHHVGLTGFVEDYRKGYVDDADFRKILDRAEAA